MRDEPLGLDRKLLHKVLQERWGLEVASLEYVPLGAGSYHWAALTSTGKGWFITADDVTRLTTNDDFEGLNAAYETAKTLRHNGLEFVVAPVQDVVRIGNWVLVLFPLLKGRSGDFGVWDSPETQVAATRCVARLHSAAPPDVIQRFDFGVRHRVALERVLQHGWPKWAGRYGEQAGALLKERSERANALLREYDELVTQVAPMTDGWVVTHGEPHSGNFITSPDGVTYLVDWDTVRLAPRERDLAVVLDDDDGRALHAYRDIAGPFEPNEAWMRYFGVRWNVADICVYARWFMSPSNSYSKDAERQLAELEKCLA